MSGVTKFIDEVLSWRADYQPQWKDAHVRKWNKYLALIIPIEYKDIRIKYNVPEYQVPMTVNDLESKSKLNERWHRAYSMYKFIIVENKYTTFVNPDLEEAELNEISDDQKDTIHDEIREERVLAINAERAGEAYKEDMVKDLENRIANLESKVDTVHETATMALEVADKVDVQMTEQAESEDKYMEHESFPDRNPEYTIPQENDITYDDAREMADILIKFGFIEDWGREYTNIIKAKSYREYQRIKLMGGYEPHISAPSWFRDIYDALKRFWMKKGKYHWQNTVTHIKHNTNGSHLLHRGKGIEDMPYGTFRNIVNGFQKDKYGKVTTEYIPYEKDRRAVISYRRYMINQYRKGTIDQIDWKPDAPYTVITTEQEFNDFWTDERRTEFRKIREEEAKRFD